MITISALKNVLHVREDLKLFWNTWIPHNRMCSTYAQLSIPTAFACWSIRAVIGLAGCTDFGFSFLDGGSCVRV